MVDLSGGSHGSTNPRLSLLRNEVEQTILKPLRSHGWNAQVDAETDGHDCIEVSASRDEVTVRIAVLYSNSVANQFYRSLEERVERIFYQGQPYKLESYAHGVTIPVEPLGDFFPFLLEMNKRIEPDRSPSPKPRRYSPRRITAENPLEAIFARLEQFTSVRLATKLVERRALSEGVELSPDVVATKATGVAFSMRSALDYAGASSSDKLNRRVLGLYYGVMAFAQAEMLASPTGPSDLDEVEGMTKQGHGLYTVTGAEGGFADLRVGVLATGYLPQWLSFLGGDATAFPRKKPRGQADLDALPSTMWCTLRDLFASMPEVDDLFAEALGGPPRWVVAVHDGASNLRQSVIQGATRKADSTYGLFVDRSGLVPLEALEGAGWPLAEVRRVTEGESAGMAFRARVDHAGHDVWWDVLPTHSSSFGHRGALLLPTLGGMREYRTIAAATLYALSIMARYMPSAWRRVDGGDEDQYLALVRASLTVWERVLPEHFLESIAGEAVHTRQPGSWMG